MHSAHSSSNRFGLSLRGGAPSPCSVPGPSGPLPTARSQLSGEEVPGPAGTFILAERREHCSQARGRRTEPFCLDFPPCYSNQQRRDKNAPFLDNGPASRFSPSVFLPRNAARTCLEAEWLSGRERLHPHPAALPGCPPGGQAGARDAAAASPTRLIPHVGRGRDTEPPDRAQGLPPWSSPRDCVSGCVALSVTNPSFFQG